VWKRRQNLGFRVFRLKYLFPLIPSKYPKAKEAKARENGAK